MKISVGSDILYIPRVKELTKSGAVSRIIKPSEILRSSDEHIAGLIALKEATVKALGLSSNDWQRITIKRHKSSKPYIDVLGLDLNVISIDCSISHDQDYAFAVVTVLYADD